MISNHKAHPGCGAIVGIKNILGKLGELVVINENCVFKATVEYPYTSWDVPVIFSNGMDAIKVGIGIEEDLDKRVVVILERKDFQLRNLEEFEDSRIVVICYDRDGWGDSNKFPLKFLGRRVYSANVSISHLKDLDEKVEKIGNRASVLNVLTPCPVIWKINPRYTIRVARMGVESLVFPLYEVYGEKVSLSLRIDEPRSIFEYTKIQGRFEGVSDEEIRRKEREYREFYDFLLRLSNV